MSTRPTLEEGFRWFGPNDPVPLNYIRQAGATGIYTSLHHIPYGELWSREEIRKRIEEVEACGLRWCAVESVPVSEAIKTRTGDFEQHIANYQQTLRNLGAEGVDLVIYNFMPVLDWVRTDLAHKLDDGSECLLFDPVKFAAFEIHLLDRPGAEADYTDEQKAKALDFVNSLSDSERTAFEQAIIDVFPGCKLGLSLDDLRQMLSAYDGIDAAKLKEHLKLFLEAVVPAAAEAGVKMAIHPDDPPFSLLGLPRILSTEQDVEDLYAMVDEPANGLCFCSGSFSPRADNDLPGIVARHGHRINAVHLRNTRRNPDGSFYEADHLDGSADMVAIVRELLKAIEGRSVPFRPDHGHTMMDDLDKPPVPNPGYTCIGRMRGLAELRGLILGLSAR